MQRSFGAVELLVLLGLSERLPKTTIHINLAVLASGATPRDMLTRVVHFFGSST